MRSMVAFRLKIMSTYYTCKLCQVHANSEESLHHHLRGRRHQDTLDQIATAERSVYVRGFLPHLVQKAELYKLFQPFGAIRKVSLGPLGNKKKLYAIVEFVCRESALRVLQHPETLHLHGKKLVVKPREVKLRRRDGRAKEEEEERDMVKETSPPRSSSPLPYFMGGVRMPQEAVAELQQATSVMQQLEVLSHHCRMPVSAVEAQISLCHMLHSVFREQFPHCLLVPFGAPISGHGTVTSDCDLCLLTESSEEDRKCFSGEAYYSEEHLAMWERVTRSDRVEDTSELASSSPLPSDQDLDVSGSSTASSTATSSSSTSPSVPQHTKRGPSVEFDVVLSIVRNLPTCSRVVAIPFARCPIVRFYYEPSRLHCDLSINNRLGPCNTQLMRAYYDFDPRLALLIPTVRMWARSAGLSRASLNNYAVSLLLIYALQHATPPVLPCLQDSRGWPRNMDWCTTRGFTTAAAVGVGRGRISPGGWKCEFTPPGSLMPSCNTASAAELLLHFFRFYSEEFDFGTHVVAVYYPAQARLTKEEVAHTAAGSTSKAKLKMTQLCVQDPFELSHNVTKSLPKVAFFQDVLCVSRDILQEQLQLESTTTGSGDLLALFDQTRYQSITSKSSKAPKLLRYLMFTPLRVTDLLQRVETLRPLRERFAELDLRNEQVRMKLAAVVVKVLLSLLEEELKFVCEVQTMQSSEPSNVEHTVGTFAMELSMEGVMPAVVAGGVLEEKMEDGPHTVGEGGPFVEEEDGGTRKRQPTEPGATLEEPKRARLSPAAPQALDLLNSAAAATDKGVKVYTCVALTNTWLHRRRAQRQQHQGEEASLTTQPPPDPQGPMLQFSLSSHEPTASNLRGINMPPGTITVVELGLGDPQQMADFAIFFAFFKKLIFSTSV